MSFFIEINAGFSTQMLKREREAIVAAFCRRESEENYWSEKQGIRQPKRRWINLTK